MFHLGLHFEKFHTVDFTCIKRKFDNVLIKVQFSVWKKYKINMLKLNVVSLS
jgi:hypothetical protein